MQYLKIKSVVQRNKPNFRVVAYFMHGDADGDSDKEFSFDNEIGAVGCFATLDIFSGVSKYDVAKGTSVIAQKLGLDYTLVIDCYNEMIPSDITCDFYSAAFQGAEIFALIDGEEREMDIIKLSEEQRIELARNYILGE